MLMKELIVGENDMTIDEAIKMLRTKLAKMHRVEYEVNCDYYGKEVVDGNKKPDCLKYAEEYEQIAEWLEQLKVYKSRKFNENIQKLSYRQGYDKAVDNFKDELFKNSERVRPVGWLEYSEIVTCEKIYDIAEKLKVGGENES